MPDTQAAVRRCYRIVASTMIGAAAISGIALTLAPGAVEASQTPPAALATASAQIRLDLSDEIARATGAIPDIVPRAKPSGLLVLRAAAKPIAPAEVNCLADAVYFEARGEPWQGQRAVAEVVLRRTRTDGYPRSICGVVYEGATGSDCQFSFACDGSTLGAHEADAWRKAVEVAEYELIGAGRFDDITGGALYFHVASLRAGWSTLQRTVEIGNHVFYRDPAAITEARTGEAASS